MTFAEGSQLERIGSCCFSRSGLEELVLPSTVKEIGEKAFYWCEQLRSVQLSAGPEKEIISGGQVSAQTTDVTALPSPLKRLETETFYWCKSLKSIGIPNGVEYIGRKCFIFSGVEEITLPGTLKEIGEEAFNNCSNLKMVWVEDGTTDVRKHVSGDVTVLPVRAKVGEQSLQSLRE